MPRHFRHLTKTEITEIVVSFHNGEKQNDIDRGRMGPDFFQERELYAIAGHALDATKPNSNAVAQFVELTHLGTEHATQMVGRVTVDDRGAVDELSDEEASAHGKILAHNA